MSEHPIDVALFAFAVTLGLWMLRELVMRAKLRDIEARRVMYEELLVSARNERDRESLRRREAQNERDSIETEAERRAAQKCREHHRAEAVKAGFAHWVLNDQTGAIEFQWKVATP